MSPCSGFGWDRLGRLGQHQFYSVAACSNSQNMYLEHLEQSICEAIPVPSVPSWNKLTWDTSDARIYSSVPTVPRTTSQPKMVSDCLLHAANRHLTNSSAVAG